MSSGSIRLVVGLSRVSASIVIALPICVTVTLLAAALGAGTHGLQGGLPTGMFGAILSSLALAAAGVALGGAFGVALGLSSHSLAPGLRQALNVSLSFIACVPAAVLGWLAATVFFAGAGGAAISEVVAAVCTLTVLAISVVSRSVGRHARFPLSSFSLRESAAAAGASQAQIAQAAWPALGRYVRPALGLAFARLFPEATALQIIFAAGASAHSHELALPLGATLLDATSGHGAAQPALAALVLLALTTLGALAARPPSGERVLG
ncbi:MAG: hypothetical protein GIW99_00655 [Candidatus Eremiobacteraeota bacterium]|nr:hypothetical protein [Candidatus Eremiobacteraeota bacterium]MBC5826195.1 hypothetical protein [Candidatus Eremiobacteraeota bacterium]